MRKLKYAKYKKNTALAIQCAFCFYSKAFLISTLSQTAKSGSASARSLAALKSCSSSSMIGGEGSDAGRGTSPVRSQSTLALNLSLITSKVSALGYFIFRSFDPGFGSEYLENAWLTPIAFENSPLERPALSLMAFRPFYKAGPVK